MESPPVAASNPQKKDPSRRVLLPLLGMVGLGLASPLPAAADPCAERYPTARLDEKLDEGERAFADLDDETFLRAVDEAALINRCLDGLISPALAARLHWLNGIQLYLRNDHQRSAASLSGARGLETAWALPESVLPKDHELRAIFDAQPAAAQVEQAPEPAQGQLYFDGRASMARPIDRATVFQLVLADQQVETTAYVFPGDGLPAYATRRRNPDRSSAGTAAPRERRRLANPWLLTGAGLSAGGAVGSWLVARKAESDFKTYDPDFTLDDLDRLQGRANAGGATATGLGVAAVGLGVSAFFVGVW
jgi:hypothetical protein